MPWSTLGAPGVGDPARGEQPGVEAPPPFEPRLLVVGRGGDARAREEADRLPLVRGEGDVHAPAGEHREGEPAPGGHLDGAHAVRLAVGEDRPARARDLEGIPDARQELLARPVLPAYHAIAAYLLGKSITGAAFPPAGEGSDIYTPPTPGYHDLLIGLSAIRRAAGRASRTSLARRGSSSMSREGDA